MKRTAKKQIKSRKEMMDILVKVQEEKEKMDRVEEIEIREQTEVNEQKNNREKINVIDKIYVNSQKLQQEVKRERKKRIEQVFVLFERIVSRFYELTNNKNWVKIKNKDVYYIDNYRFLIADSTRWTCGRKEFIYEFSGYLGRSLEWNEAYELFYNRKRENPLIDSNGRIIDKGDEYSNSYYLGCKYGSEQSCIDNRYGSRYQWGFGVSDTIKIPVYDCNKSISKLELFAKEWLFPDGLNPDEEELFRRFFLLYQENYLAFEGERYFLTESFYEAVYTGNYNELNGFSFRESDILALQEIQDEFLSEYLNCDYRRAEIDPYDSKILEDIERGHWDLFEMEETGVPIKLQNRIVARNPLADIQNDGIVGIDFGTKSTVVVYQNGDNNTWPMRVGSGKYKKEIRYEDYENPTVMEFRNLKHFMECYRAKKGRPETLWEDLTISHKAAEQLKSENDSSRFYSFFSDLKQWCGDKSRQIRIRDNQGFEKELPAFLEIDEDDFNPIELYAYYLGLYINNMRQKIYLNYILSFPVTYEKNVKEKILNSFARGIKKSLPETVLNDEATMKNFQVRQRSSEPAAYAICALTEYQFDPQGDEKVFYGIFDFGGGTTDFDYGIWKASSRRRYDNVIEHFGAGGDQYLGGERLLEMLAFHVFKQNKEALLRAGIPFYRPQNCENFVGSEDLLYDSQEARLNIKQLMEKLRGLWQNDDEEAIAAIEEGKIRLLLFTKTGQLEPNFELMVNKEELLQRLRNRIEDGVKNFFAAMVQTFKKEDLKDAKGINIFLAGNSSKSEIVKELFQQYSEQWTQQIQSKYELSPEETAAFFRIFPPLGTEEARRIQEERGYIADKEKSEFTRPTGKTGVAYGLILGRPGSRIEIRDEIKNTDEIKFKYYIGYEKKKIFRTVIDRDVEYHQWVYFTDALETDFEFYYTTLPDAAFNQMSISGISKKLCRIQEANEDEDEVGIFIRAVEPGVIEYAVAFRDKISQGEYLEEPRRVELG